MSIIKIIDLETTGFEPPKAEVCEIGFVDLDIETMSITNKGSMLVKPERPIPPENSAIHHIIDEDVADALSWDEASKNIFGAHANTPPPIAMAAHNAKFEKQFCTKEMTNDVPWICTFKCGLRLFPDASSHSNQGLRYNIKPEGLDRTLATETHRALPDAYVTAFLLREMLKKASIEELIHWSNLPALHVICRIGQHRGMKWSEVEYGFLEWVSTRDFDEDIIYTVETEMRRRMKG